MNEVHVLSLPYHDGRRAVGMGRGPIELLERHGLAGELERRGFVPVVQEVPEPEEGTAIGPDVNALAGAPRMGEIAAAVDDLSRRVRNVYLHVDLDALDPAQGRANEYAAPGGLSLETLTDAIALVGEWLEVRAAAVTAYDPALDVHGDVAHAAVAVAAAAADAGVRRAS